jgi:hypothetical protein
MSSYEERVAILKSEGLSPIDARRTALAEIKMLKHNEAEEQRKDAKRKQANVRIALNVAKFAFNLFRK